MIRSKLILSYLIIPIFSIFFYFLLSATALAANFPLEITNIKPSGTGSPAIPATNRIFRAYPGIEYNIRAAVIGGAYPYTFSIDNAPAGMTIDKVKGEITWLNPQTNAGPITLTVTDTENTKVNTSWSITVTTSGFLFVNSSYSGIETGNFTQPYSSIYNMLYNTLNGDNTRIIYFRGGDYILTDWESPSSNATNLTNNPGTWLGYPGETVNIDGDERFFVTYATLIYFDKLNLSSFIDYGLLSSSDNDYMTVRRCNWSDITGADSVNDNEGFIFVSNGSPGSYIVIQDNSFSNFTGAQAIGSLYNGTKTLIENNHIFDGGFSGAHGFCTPIGIKTSNTYYTIRGNKIILPGNATDFEIYNELTIADHAEFLFNYVAKKSGGNDQALRFFYPTYFYMFRNTFAGDISFIPGLSNGPYYFTNNVLVGSLLNPTYVIQNNNLTGTSGDNIISSEGLLTSRYENYVGSRGWQLRDGSTPLEVNYTPPSTTRPQSPIGFLITDN